MKDLIKEYKQAKDNVKEYEELIIKEATEILHNKHQALGRPSNHQLDNCFLFQMSLFEETWSFETAYNTVIFYNKLLKESEG